MDVKLFGFERLDRLPEDGDLVAGTIRGANVLGLAGRDQEGRYVLVLRGKLSEDEELPQIISMKAFDGRLGVIEGEVSVEPLAGGFAGKRVDIETPGALVMGEPGLLGIAVLYRQSIQRTSVFHYDLKTGAPIDPSEVNVGMVGWRMLVRQAGRDEPFEVARFGE